MSRVLLETENYKEGSNSVEAMEEILKVKTDAKKKFGGVDLVRFSCDGRYMVTMLESYPCLLWVWDVILAKLHGVVVQKRPVRCLKFSPTNAGLFAFTGTDKIVDKANERIVDKVYLWHQFHGVTAVEIPSQPGADPVRYSELEFSSNGNRLCLTGKGVVHCCSFISNPESAIQSQ
uniref:Uncharacterized protein n=2 Tax=Octactis speculum TaxID=3111310 RepID=A0A7S2AT68_9STRA|mmetsp:Transcript_152/g.193  ORF Transcript_152/g.193 Transcript_152/m.193 type:complete len:176 (+) Transcript_152:46-573(+)